MDGLRFDALTHTFASGISRRRALQSLGAGAVALLGRSRTVGPANAGTRPSAWPATPPASVPN